MTNQEQIIEKIFGVAQIIFIVGWAYFIFFHLTHYHPIEFPNSGEDDFYLRMAHMRTQGKVPIDPFRPILYVLMTAGVTDLFDVDVFFAGKLVSHLFGLLFIITTILIGNKLFSRGVGLLAGTLLVLTYIVNFITMTASTDMAFSATALLTLLVSLHYAEKRSWAWLIIVAFCTAMSYFLRYTSIFLAVPIGLLLINAHWDRKIDLLKRGSVFVALLFLFLIPHMYYTHQMFGELFYNEAWKNISIKLYSNINQFDTPYALLRDSYPLLIKTGLDGVNRFFLTGLDGFTSPQISILRWIFHATFFIGLYQTYKQHKIPTIALFAFFIVYIFLVGFTFYLMNRLIVIVLPIYFLFIANGLLSMLQAFTRNKTLQLVGIGVLLCTAFIIYTPHLTNQLNDFYDKHTLAEHNTYIRLYAQADDIAIVASDVHAWRLGIDRYRRLPIGNPSMLMETYFDLILERVINIEADYVVVGTVTGKRRNVPEQFVTGKQYPEWLTIIDSNEEYIVYAVNQTEQDDGR